ncbi:MAG: hypothetical protein ACSHWU_07820, partial [Marinicella sp.]
MKTNINPLTKALRYALITGLATTSSIGSFASAQDGDDDSVEEQGKITVTGSRIKRSDVEGALPIT